MAAGRQLAQVEAKILGNLREVLLVLDQLLNRRLMVVLLPHCNEGAWMSGLGSYLVSEKAELSIPV